MLESSGRTTVESCRVNATVTPNTASGPTPSNFNLTSRLSTATGPVKNSNDPKAYLEQRLLIAIDGNFKLVILANLLISTSLDPKIPDHATNIIGAVALFTVSNLQIIFADKIVAVVADKLPPPPHK